jgi:hypothetical protein
MQEPNGLNDEQRELELALRSLPPATARIDPIAAAFTAGRKSSRRQLRLWRSAATLILLIAVGSRLITTARNSAVAPSDISDTTVAIHTPPAPPAPQSLQVLQETVREKGLDGLPSADIPSVQIISIGNLF